MNRAVVTGAGGFIGGHLVKRLVADSWSVVAVDKKPICEWEQVDKHAACVCRDLSDIRNCRFVADCADAVFHLAADMGGIEYITSHHSDCMKNTRLTLNMLEASAEAGVSRFVYASSACVYNQTCQTALSDRPLKESDAHPADPEPGYGWEKLYGEKLVEAFCKDYGMGGRIVRFHNVYGPMGTWEGGREKAPAALCRKVAAFKLLNQPIEIIGDGSARRSFLYVDDCVNGLLRILWAKKLDCQPVNLGSSQTVTIAELLNMILCISGVGKQDFGTIQKRGGAVGVAFRSSDNTLLEASVAWTPQISLEYGLDRTYAWIEAQVARKYGA